MKTLFILLLASNISFSQGNVRWKSVSTYSSELLSSGKWSEWEKSDNGDGILIIRDGENDKISVYAKNEKQYSVIDYQQLTSTETHNKWKFTCVDNYNNKCRAYIYYSKNTNTTYSMLVIEYGDVKLKYIMDEER